ncbi:MAG: C39 family peptidase [Methanomicrobiales archaeon]|nr:C39 family peptidase [Methanomicrobiales archaeon]
MKLRKISIVLLALLLAAMAMIPMVSAVEDTSARTRIIEQNYITKSEAVKDAQAELSRFVENGLLDMEFSGAVINPEPVEIYDINGMRLYYSFPIEDGKKRVGEVKIAASRVFGAPVISIGHGPKSFNREELNTKAAQILKQAGFTADISSARLVCYAYPKIGLIIRSSTGSNSEKELIIDAYDYSVIPESDRTSLYDSMTLETMKSGVASWEAQKTGPGVDESRAVSPRATISKTLSGFTLYSQEKTNWCAFATAKMISRWYGITRSQTQIATTVLGSDQTNQNNGATEIQMRDEFYRKSIQQGGLGKSGSNILLGSPTNLYNLIKTEIDGNRPVVINIGIQPGQSSNYHARACAGYSRDMSSGNTYFYIYDPWPVNSGSLTWERWQGGITPYTSSIFVL